MRAQQDYYAVPKRLQNLLAGDPAESVFYIQQGRVKAQGQIETGQRSVIAILGGGEFLGEACLIGQTVCLATATTIVPSTILRIDKKEMQARPPRGAYVFRPFSYRTCFHASRARRRIWSINFSTPASNGWPALFCCSPTTVRKAHPKL